MHHLTALSLKNRALIALVTIVAAVFGLLGVGSLKQELMPSVQFPAIAVVTSYPGASPEVVNKEVSTPIETALRGVPQLESSNATSSTGASMVLAQFTYGVDIAATEQKVERAVSRISQLLPAAADTQVMSGSIDDFPVIQIAVTPADGQTPEEAAAIVERIAIADLSDLDGVRDAQLSGARPDRITIVPNFEALGAQGIGVQAITDTLQQSGVLVAAGSITEGEQTLSVQAGSTVASAEDIAALPLPVSAEQMMAQQEELARQQAPARPGVQPEAEPAPTLTPITIGSVAEVRLEPGPVESISRVDGAPALTIAVTKTSAANTVEVSHAVQDQLAELEDQLGGITLNVVFDQAPYVEDSIETLTTEGLLGLLFAVLVILVFLMSVRATLVTAISIPTSVLLTFIGLNFADYTLNMLTLGALTISIGRVVDDSIVVVENIKRHLVSDTDRAATITMAVREVAGAITASTITTVAVFLPMAFVAGMVGELFRPFAFTVTIALVASLLVSLTIVPVLAYWFLKPGHARRRETAVAEADPAQTRLQRWYRPVIDWTLRRPAVTLMIAALVFGGTIAASPLMKTNFMGADEQNSVGLVQTLAPGTSLDAQLAQAERVEQVLAELPEVETVQVTIGSSGGGMAAIFGGGGDGAVNYSLTTDPDANQEEAQDAIRAAVNGLDDAGEFSLGQSGGGVTMSSAIEVVVSAPDQDTLASASDAVLAELRDQDGLKQVESDLALSRPYLAITVDRAAAAAAGLTEAGVAGQVAQQMQPNQIGQITLNSTTTSVYLADTVAPTDQAGVAALPIQTAVGPQALSALATVAVADGPVTIRTEDTARVVTISALPQGDDLTAASAAVNRALDAVELPAGAKATIGGVMSQQAEAFEQLGIALLAAILIVYVVMVATFRSLLQPLLLLISVPFAATGAILLLIVTGIPLGVASLIGVLMLIGIVVTNAIVLIDLVNQYRDRGEPLKEAVTHGSLQRLRPIVMTALATILALTPMALGITGKGGFISQPLAVVVIGGLLSSTVLTLVVLPTLYYAVERRREGRGGPRDPGVDPEPKRPRGPLRRRGATQAAVTSGATGPDGLVLAGSGLAGAAALAAVDHAGVSDVAGIAGAAGATGVSGVSGAGHLDAERAGDVTPAPVAEPGTELVAEGGGDAELAAAEPATETVPVPAPVAAPVSAPVSAPVPEPVSAPVPIVLPEPRTVPAEPQADAPQADAREPEAREPEVADPAPRSVPDAPAPEMGPNTQQMSLDFEDLGFVGADNPIDARLGGSAATETETETETEPEPSVPSAPEPEATTAPRDEEAATMEADPTAFTPEVFDFAVDAPRGEPAADPAADPIDARPDVPDATDVPEVAEAPAPPVTGELNWEQLLWQATQEIDEEVAAGSSNSEGSSAAEPSKNEGGAHGVAPDDTER